MKMGDDKIPPVSQLSKDKSAAAGSVRGSCEEQKEKDNAIRDICLRRMWM